MSLENFCEVCRKQFISELGMKMHLSKNINHKSEIERSKYNSKSIEKTSKKYLSLKFSERKLKLSNV